MNKKFVKTENANRFFSAIDRLKDRAASEACLIVVDGVPGLGKSATLDWWAARNDCVFIRAKKEWTPNWMMRELLAAMGITPEYSFPKMFQQALAALGDRNFRAEEQGEFFAVVIDEVDHISRSERLLETLRDLSDLLEVPFVLVGMGKVRHHLTRFPQIASRVGQYVAFKPASLEDMQSLVADLTEVEVKPDLVAFLHRASGGLFREALEGIKVIEAFGQRNGMAVGCADMASEILMNDRRTGKPIVVRG